MLIYQRVDHRLTFIQVENLTISDHSSRPRLFDRHCREVLLRCPGNMGGFRLCQFNYRRVPREDGDTQQMGTQMSIVSILFNTFQSFWWVSYRWRHSLMVGRLEPHPTSWRCFDHNVLNGKGRLALHVHSEADSRGIKMVLVQISLTNH